MGWSNLILRHGLRLRNHPDLGSKIRAALAAQRSTGEHLRLMDLSPTLKDSERGEHRSERFRRDELERDTYESCCEAEGYCLLYFVQTTLSLDDSNGIRLDSNRCYGGGFLEFLRGDYDVQPLTETQMNVLKAVAKEVGVEFKLTFSLAAQGSGLNRSSFRFDEPKIPEEEQKIKKQKNN